MDEGHEVPSPELIAQVLAAADPALEDPTYAMRTGCNGCRCCRQSECGVQCEQPDCPCW